jgi:hypothetical protein
MKNKTYRNRIFNIFSVTIKANLVLDFLYLMDDFCKLALQKWLNSLRPGRPDYLHASPCYELYVRHFKLMKLSRSTQKDMGKSMSETVGQRYDLYWSPEGATFVLDFCQKKMNAIGCWRLRVFAFKFLQKDGTKYF